MDINEKLTYLMVLFPRLKYAMYIIEEQYNNKQFNKFDIFVTSNLKGDISSWGVTAYKGKGKPRLEAFIYDNNTNKNSKLKWKN